MTRSYKPRPCMLSRPSRELLAFVDGRGEAGATIEEICAAFPNRVKNQMQKALGYMRVGNYVEAFARGPGSRWLVTASCRRPDTPMPDGKKAEPNDVATDVDASLDTDHLFARADAAAVAMPFAPASVFNLGLPSSHQSQLLPRHRVRLEDFDMQHGAEIWLPFAPYPGLMLRAPFYDGDFVKVDQVYWEDQQQRFMVFLEHYPIGEDRLREQQECAPVEAFE